MRSRAAAAKVGGPRIGPRAGPRARLLAGLVAGAAALLAACAAPEPGGAALPRTWSGPYQDVTQGFAGGSDLQVRSPPWLAPPAPGRVLFWAFASGECGHERWGPHDGAAFAAANVAAALAAGRDYVVATGGEAGIFTCGSDEDMARFVERYLSPRLVGLDFDIEGKQTPAQIRALAERAAFVQRRWPQLRLSFTLATHAAADGSRRNLNATGLAVLQALRDARVDSAVINLMVMNYGPGEARWCVPAEAAQAALPGQGAAPRCDMARSALQAARNVHEVHGIAYSRIALTLMLGENDVAGNVTTPEDAAAVAAAARELGLAGVHHWSLDRDQPCPAGAPRVSPLCHGLPGIEPGRFGRLLDAAAARR